MKNLKIFIKLLFSHTLIALLAIIPLSILFYFLLRNNLIDRTHNQLLSINILKGKLVDDYFSRSQQNLEALQVEHKFTRIYEGISSPGNHFSIYDTDVMDISNLCKLYDFKSVNLYNLNKQQLFSTDSNHYTFALMSKIDSLIRVAPERMQLIDASNQSPKKETLLFYYIPIVINERRVGFVLVEENFQKVQSILLETTGMGTTGETYIVGHDYAMRSSSRFWPDKPPGSILARTTAVDKSFQGLSGSEIIQDYRGEKVLSVYHRVANRDLNWVIISEIDWNEAMQPIRQLQNYLIILCIFSVLFITLITFFLSRTIAEPILKLREILTTLSKGLIPVHKTTISTTDEIGQMAAAVYQLINGLERTSKFAAEIGSGNFNTSFVTLSDQDALGSSLLHMRDALKELNEHEMKLARSRTSALLEGQENERRRIIKELHDGVGQLLTAIRMRVEVYEGEPELKEDIKKQINDTIAEVRRISYNVMPQALIDYGLEAALRGLCDTMKKYSNLTIDFRYVKECEHQLSFDVSIALFRIAQEGLNNIIKYAEATEVSLHIIDKEDEIYFILEDNGKGFKFDAMTMNTGFGLQNIKERTKLLNGSAEIHSTPGEGTAIEIHIPLL